MSGVGSLYLMAGFQVTINGRFWVVTEGYEGLARFAKHRWARKSPLVFVRSSRESFWGFEISCSRDNPLGIHTQRIVLNGLY
jgi:hypothetical protein